MGRGKDDTDKILAPGEAGGYKVVVLCKGRLRRLVGEEGKGREEVAEGKRCYRRML